MKWLIVAAVLTLSLWLLRGGADAQFFPLGLKIGSTSPAVCAPVQVPAKPVILSTAPVVVC